VGLIDRLQDIPRPIRLEFGGGGTGMSGYINCDMVVDPETGLVIRLDTELPLPSYWADEIAGIHVLEHMPWTNVEAIFKEWVRVLRPGGIMVIEVPNMKNVFEGVLNGSWHLQFNGDNRGGNAMVPIWGEVTPNEFMHHKMGFTPELLKELYTRAGLTDLQWTDNHGVPMPETQLGWAMRLRGRKT